MLLEVATQAISHIEPFFKNINHEQYFNVHFTLFKKRNIDFEALKVNINFC